MKTCLECIADAESEAETCPLCGGASWSEPIESAPASKPENVPDDSRKGKKAR